MIVEIVFDGTNNDNSVTFKQDLKKGAGPQPINFNSPVVATRMTLTLSDGVVVDTDVAGQEDFIDWEKAGLDVGEVIFNFTTLNAITPVTFLEYLEATLRFYDAAHLNGQVLVHIKDEKLKFLFCET